MTFRLRPGIVDSDGCIELRVVDGGNGLVYFEIETWEDDPRQTLILRAGPAEVFELATHMRRIGKDAYRRALEMQKENRP